MSTWAEQRPCAPTCRNERPARVRAAGSRWNGISLAAALRLGTDPLQAVMSNGAVGVIGAGLIGTSIGLALERTGREVLMLDVDRTAVELAEQLGAGIRWPTGQRVDHAVLAVPPRAMPAVLLSAQRTGLASTFSDVGSVKVNTQREAETLRVDMGTFCGGHPIAGRERSGASAARPDLFEGRPWVLTPGPLTSAVALRATTELAQACGAHVLTMTAAEHDDALALVSHVPQLVASLLAARLEGSPEEVLRLAGTGLRDTTRIAGSDPALWSEVIAANPIPTRRILAELAADLDRLLVALAVDQQDNSGPTGPANAAGAAESELTTVVHDLVRRGNTGRHRLPGKHGVRATYAPVPVVIEDAPGRLALLLADAADAGVNVEDLVIEHAPGRPRGVAELAVRPADAAKLAVALRARGWSVHLPGPAASDGAS